MNTANSIREIIQASNRVTLNPQGIQIEFLKNCSQTIPTLIEWVYAEWRSYDSSLTREKLMKGFNSRLNDDRIPLTLVALKNGIPVGTVSLKQQTEPEFGAICGDNPWLGSLHVIHEERDKGLGGELLNNVKAIAMCLGYNDIYLYTSNPANVEWYNKRGAHSLVVRSFRNHMITIMHIHLQADANRY